MALVELSTVSTGIIVIILYKERRNEK